MDQPGSIYGLVRSELRRPTHLICTNNSNCESAALRSSAALVLGPIFSLPRASMQPVPHLSPKVDVMVLYTHDAWFDLWDYKYERELSTKMVKEFEQTNEAMRLSEITGLKVKLVYMARVSAGVEEARPCGTQWWSFCVTEAVCRCLITLVWVVDVDGSSYAKISETYAPLAVGAPGH